MVKVLIKREVWGAFMKRVNWNVVIACGALTWGIVVFYDCAPVSRSQLVPMMQRSNAIHEMLYRNEIHNHGDLRMIMEKLHVPHSHQEDIQRPPELEMKMTQEERLDMYAAEGEEPKPPAAPSLYPRPAVGDP